MNNTPNNSKDFIDVASTVKEWISKWYWFVISVIVCLGAAYGYTKIRKNQYLVNANLLISQEEGGGLGSFGGLSNLFGSNGRVDDELFVVASHSVLRDAVKDLGLNRSHLVKDGFMNTNFYYKGYPVEVSASPEIADTLRNNLLFIVNVKKNGSVKIRVEDDHDVISKTEHKGLPVTINTEYGSFTVSKTESFMPDESFKTIIYYSGYDAAAENIAKNLAIDQAGRKANVVALSMETTDIDYGCDILNGIIDQYNKRGVREKNVQARQTAEFIDARLTLLSADLDEAETNVEQYKRDKGLTDIYGDVKYQMEKRGALETELIAAETKAEVLKMTREFLNNSDNAYSLIPDIGSYNDGKSSNNTPIDAYNELIIERMNLTSNAKPNNIVIRQLDDKLDAMRENIKASLDRAYAQQSVVLGELRSQVGKTDSRLGAFPTQEREFKTIRRQQAIKESLYLYLLQRREETALLIANSVPKGIIVDEAYALQEPLGMGRKMIFAIVLVLGLCMTPVLLYLKRLLRTKFDTREEVERLTPIPMLGEVCISRSKEPLVVHASGSSSTAELFRLIRTNLQFVLNDKDDKVILLTSTTSGEGKSFISINLAASLAMLGKKVLLVGMDIRAPKLAEYMHLSSKWGLTQYLSSDKISLNDLILKNAIADNLDVILAGPVPPNPAELLVSDAVDRLFGELRGMYDYIIVDSAPVGMVSDTFTLARISDATVYVCRANYTPLKDFAFINNVYDQKRLKKMGLVVNGTTARKGYGYGYGYTEKEDK